MIRLMIPAGTQQPYDFVVTAVYLTLLMSVGGGPAIMRFVIEVDPGMQCAVLPKCTIGFFVIHTQDDSIHVL
jgi:hypothetical protein